MTGRVVHFEIPFDDGERARAFYAEAFGWDVAAVPGMDYSMVSTGPSTETGPNEPGYVNGGMAQRGEPLTGPTVVIDVEDIEESLAKVEELGGVTLLRSTPVGEMGFSGYFRDTEGNVIGLWQSRSSD